MLLVLPALMHESIPWVRAVAAAALLTVLASACGAEPAERPAESAEEAVDEWTRPVFEHESVQKAVEREYERLRRVEGRTGILAEERRYSTFDEELIIRDFFQDRRGGFFLDVGCAWPIRANNTYYLEKHLGWKGIGVDALAEYAPAWKQERPSSRFFSNLVTDRSGDQETFFRSPSTGLSSTDRTWAAGKLFGDSLEPEEVKVESITLDDLLEREEVGKIDLLSMDIEGHEPKALAGFDIDRFRPELVVIERPFPPKQVGRDQVHGYFEEHGYELIEKYRPFDAVNWYFRPKGS